MDNLKGTQLKSYIVGDMIGMGAFGVVYRAHQTVIERDVAIKIIWPAFANHPNFIRKFEAEAQLVAGLEHPHIVPLYDYWREPDGAYIVMRWLRGGALRDQMDGTPWALEDVARILSQVAAALTLAHRAGIIHRDLKPENILMDEQDNAYLGDFGIAQILSNARDTEDEFDSMGSPAYAAPEQLLNDPLQAQTDIFSLGLMLWELLAGHHPFPDLAELSQTQLVYTRTTKPLPSLRSARPDLPPGVDEVLATATAFHPSNRYPDALAFAKAFREASQVEVTKVRTNSIRITALDDALIPNPYKGLRAFQESDSQHFFGRAELVERFLERLKAPHRYQRFLAVIGPSGSGKSSVVKAGLLPRLRQGGLPGSSEWYFTEMVPGINPFDELESDLLSLAAHPPADLGQRLRQSERGLLEVVNQILPNDGSELLMVIDQFEEVFTLTDNESASQRFLESLYIAVTDPHSRIRIIVTLRADFYDRPLKHPQMSALMRERTEVVVPLSTIELEEAIVRPAELVNVTIEPSLVSAIIAEINEQPAALPLLQYTLSELFDRRIASFIGLEAYRQLGGVKGSLARRADEIYSEFTLSQQEVARQVFLRLVTLGEGTEDTRRRALLAEVTSLQDELSVVRQVVDQLGKARLLIFDRDPVTRSPTVEVTHEAIIREWQRLRAWLDESRNDVRMQRTLANLSQEWENNRREASFLLRGIRLDQYEKWVMTASLQLSLTEKSYLAASIDEKLRQAASEQARQAREKALEQRSFNRLRLLVAVLAVAFVIAFALTGVAIYQSNNAQDARRRAENALNLSISTTQGVRAQAQSQTDGDLAVVLALEANGIPNPSIESQRILAEVALAPGTRHVLRGHQEKSFVSSTAISPDGRTIISGGGDFSLILWDANTGQLIRRFAEGHRGDVQSVAFSPDGQQVVSSGLDFQVIIWDVATGQMVHQLRGHRDVATSAAFSPDGRFVLSGSKDTTLILWDAATGQEQRRFEGLHNARIYAIQFLPNGQQVMTASDNVVLLNLATGEAIQRYDLPTAIGAMTLSTDGQHMLTGTSDASLVLWDVPSATIQQTFEEDAGTEIVTLAFAPQERFFMVGTETGRIELWDVATGQEYAVLSGHNDGVMALGISNDGRFAVSASKDSTLRIWNVAQMSQLAAWPAHTNRVTALAVSSNAQQLYSASNDGLLQLSNTTTAQVESQLARAEGGWVDLNLSPDGEQLVAVNQQGAVQLYSTADNSLLKELSGSPVIQLARFDPTGRQIALVSNRNEVILWDVATWSEVRRFGQGMGRIRSLLYTPDGQQMVVNNLDEIQVWSIATGTRLRIVADSATIEEIPTAFFSMALHPDGQTIAIGTREASIYLFDLATGQQRLALSGHTDAVFSLAFSPDGQVLASGGRDNSILLWDVASGSELQRFSLDSTAYTLLFIPTGETLIAGEGDGQLSLWRRFTLPELIAWTRENRYLRPLTCSEREFYRVSPLCSEGEEVASR